MGWYAAPVAKQAWADAQKKFPGVSFLGFVGDLNHQGSYSGHNPGRWAEANRYNYGSYDGRAVLAVDIGVPNAATGYAVLNGIKNDPRVLYTIYRAVGYRPAWRGGGTWSASGHMTHVHVSFTARATHDTRPFFGASSGSGSGSVKTNGELFTVGQMEILGEWMKDTRKHVDKSIDDAVTDLKWGIVAALQKQKEDIIKELDCDE